jgi:uncharacterized Tic20 family protein
MTFESFRNDLRSFTSSEWAMVAVVVLAFAFALDTLGLILGPVIAYALVMAYRRDRQKADAAKGLDTDTPAS